MSSEIQLILITSILGVILILIGYFPMLKKDRLVKIGIEAEGTVIGFESGGDGMHHPLIRFETIQGARITKKHAFGSNVSFVKEGQKIKIFYNPDNPEEFVIVSSALRWDPYVFVLVGIISLGIGLFKLYEFFTD
jgi:Protein of unknown function (DUF3592)